MCQTCSLVGEESTDWSVYLIVWLGEGGGGGVEVLEYSGHITHFVFVVRRSSVYYRYVMDEVGYIDISTMKTIVDVE